MEKSPRHETVLDNEMQRVADVYAEAFIGVGQKQGSLDEILDQLRSFVEDVLDRLTQVDQFLRSPRVPIDAKSRMIDRMLEGRADRNLINFLKVLARKHRLNAVRAIYRAARQRRNEMQGRVEATLVTATEISDELRNRVSEQLQKKLGKQIVLRPHVQPELIGGMVIRIGDTVYDASLANQLDRARAAIAGRVVNEIKQSVERFAS